MCHKSEMAYLFIHFSQYNLSQDIFSQGLILVNTYKEGDNIPCPPLVKPELGKSSLKVSSVLFIFEDLRPQPTKKRFIILMSFAGELTKNLYS